MTLLNFILIVVVGMTILTAIYLVDTRNYIKDWQEQQIQEEFIEIDNFLESQEI